MSSSKFSPDSGEYGTETVTLYDEFERSLECSIENSLELEGDIYLLLSPIDSPIIILTGDEEEDDDELYGEAIIIEEIHEIEEIFADAKAVLGELNLNLKNTAYTLTASGDLPDDFEEEDLITLEIDEENSEEEKLQVLSSFYFKEERYNVCTPITPLFFVAKYDSGGNIEILSPEDELLPQVLDELLFEETE